MIKRMLSLLQIGRGKETCFYAWSLEVKSRRLLCTEDRIVEICYLTSTHPPF